MSRERKHRLHVVNVMKAFAVIYWLYFSYFIIGGWAGFSFGMLLQKFELINPTFVDLPMWKLLLIHFVGFLAVLINTFSVALYWIAFRTTYEMMVALLSLPVVAILGVVRRVRIRTIRRVCHARLVKSGWFRQACPL